MTPAETTSRWHARAHVEPLGRSARVWLLVLVFAVLVADSVVRAVSPSDQSVLRAALGTFLTLSAGLFAWRPLVATAMLSFGIVAATAVGGTIESLIAGATVLGLVAVTCSGAVVTAYSGVIVACLITELVRSPSGLDAGGAAVIALVALTSYVVGVGVREQRERSRSLARRLHADSEALQNQLKAERRRIADELHDIVAHELTIVAMHARVLDRTTDPEVRHRSQKAITDASTQALADIRRMLGVARDQPSDDDPSSPLTQSFESALATTTRDLEDAGISVHVDRPADLELSRSVAVALAHVVRESSVNVLKHATGARTVTISLSVQGEGVVLTVHDDSPPARSAGLPPSGYGLRRMEERLRALAGSLRAERRDDGWWVVASLPTQR